MTVALAPNIEKIVSDAIRTATGVRVVGQPPENTTTAWVRVTQLGGTSPHPSDHLIEFLVQTDSYAGATGGQPEAASLGRDVRKALMDLPQAGTVAGVNIVGHARIPDDTFEPARERVEVTATVWAHA